MRAGALLGAGLALAGGSAGLALAGSAAARSLAIRLLSHRLQRNVAAEHGLAITSAIERGEWVRVALVADLSGALSEVAGRPLQAVAWSHFAGFGGRPFSSWLDPLSPYYQAWLGAYAIYATEGPPFGYGPSGKIDAACAQQLLEADQRLVLRSAGLETADPPGSRVQPRGEVVVEHVVAWGGDWVKLSGAGDTISAYQREGRLAGGRARWLYGVVPNDYAAGVEDFHPLQCEARLWLRHEPALGATLAKFFVVASYVDAMGGRWQRGLELESECAALLDGIRFDRVVAT